LITVARRTGLQNWKTWLVFNLLLDSKSGVDQIQGILGVDQTRVTF